MKAPVWRLKKKEIVWLSRHRCKKHGHSFLEHYNCYLRENPLNERIGSFDIETSSLNAVYGYVFSYCIKEHGGGLFGRVVTRSEILSYVFDKNLINEMMQVLKKFDRLIVYYGKDRRHDIPFIRSRAVLYNLEFPEYGEINITDVYDIIRGKFRLHNNRLGTICDYLDIEAKVHKLTPKIWCYASAGHTPSLKHIFEHNKEDVISLEKLYNKVINFSAKRDCSL